jgi:hypothetical protein
MSTPSAMSSNLVRSRAIDGAHADHRPQLPDAGWLSPDGLFVLVGEVQPRCQEREDQQRSDRHQQ